MLLRFRWRGLRTRILAWSFIPTALILLAVALVTFNAYQSVTADLVIGRNRELTRLSAGQLYTELTQYADELGVIARKADFHADDGATQRAALNREKDRLVVFDGGVLILDPYGKVVACEPPRVGLLGQDWSNRNYYRQILRTNRPAFSDSVNDGPDGQPVVAVAAPITGDEGEFRGTIVGMFRLGASTISAFYGGIVKLRIGENGRTFMVDGSGQVIYHSDPERIGEDFSQQYLVQEVLDRKVGELRTRDAGGQQIVASYAPVPGTNWGLVTEEAWDSLMASSQGYRLFLAVLLALGVIVPVVVVGVGVRRITEPINHLIQAAREVAGGKFGQKIQVRTGGELEELATQFNIMSAELQQSYAQLEQRVADRTRELAAVNAVTAVASRSLDLDEVLHNALDKTLEVLGMDGGAAFRLDESSQRLVLVAGKSLSRGFVRRMSEVPLSIASLPVGRGEPVIRLLSDYEPGPLREALAAEGLALVVSVPFLAKGKVLGAITFGARTPRPVQPEEVSLLSAIGQQIGVALENARLYERAEQSAAAAERNRLARDLHDAVSQTLFSASLIADVLPRLWERNPEEGRRRLEELRQLTRGALAEMRTLLLELRPTALTEAGLGDLLRQLSEAITGRARIPVSVMVEGSEQLPAEVQVAFYRIAQEALNNVAKHAGAKMAEVGLRLGPGLAELCIRDDGRGFDPGEVSADHLGLGIMHERAEAIGATVQVTTKAGSGTVVSVLWSGPH